MKRTIISLCCLMSVGIIVFLSCSSENKPDRAIEISVNNIKLQSYEFKGEATVPLEAVSNILGYHNRKYVQGGSEKIFVASKNNYMYFYKNREYYSSRKKKLNEKHKLEGDEVIEESYNRVEYENKFKPVLYGGNLYIPVSVVDSDEGLEIIIKYIDNGYRIGRYTQAK
ncbi:MAG: hypothetical protein RR838_03120 [Clostridium sp.]